MKETDEVIIKKTGKRGRIFEMEGDRIFLINHQGRKIWNGLIRSFKESELRYAHPSPYLIDNPDLTGGDTLPDL